MGFPIVCNIVYSIIYLGFICYCVERNQSKGASMTPEQMSYFGYGFIVGGCFVVLIGMFYDEIKRGKHD